AATAAAAGVRDDRRCWHLRSARNPRARPPARGAPDGAPRPRRRRAPRHPALPPEREPGRLRAARAGLRGGGQTPPDRLEGRPGSPPEPRGARRLAPTLAAGELGAPGGRHRPPRPGRGITRCPRRPAPAHDQGPDRPPWRLALLAPRRGGAAPERRRVCPRLG